MAWSRGVERNGKASRDDAAFGLMGKSSLARSEGCCLIKTSLAMVDPIKFWFVMTKNRAFGRIKTAVLPLSDEQLGPQGLFYPITSETAPLMAII